MHRTRLIIGVATAAAVLTIAASSSSHPPTIHTDALITDNIAARQHQLHTVADPIQDLVDHKAAGTDGYAGIVMDPARQTMHLYWKGVLPDLVQTLVNTIPTGYHVAVEPAAYTRQEMTAAIDRFTASAKGASGEWTSVFPQPEGTGIEISYNPATSHRTAGPNPTTDAYAKNAASIAGIPVTSHQSPGFTRLDGTRHDARSPWFAGAELQTPANQFCSTGFAGWRDKTRVILTASHCGTSGDYRTGTGAVIGTAADSNTSIDITMIRIAGTQGARFFDSAWNNSAGSSRAVYGPGRNNKGDSVCTSGAMSGWHCDILVTNVDGQSSDENGRITKPVDVAEHQGGHAIVAAGGDSGGPVVANPSGPNGDMEARGIIVGGGHDTKIGCTAGTDTALATTCYWQVLYVPMTPIVDGMGFSLA